MEDLSLSYLDPIAYHDIARLLQTKQDERKESVAKMMEEVENLLKENHYQYRILGRAKSIYSIYKKMFKNINVLMNFMIFMHSVLFYKINLIVIVF